MDISPTAKLKMLIVDDEPDNLDLLYRTFRLDFQVLRSESAIEALKLLEKHGEVAIIISDQRMPEMLGTEFLSKTAEHYPDTIRIVLTAYTESKIWWMPLTLAKFLNTSPNPGISSSSRS